jgi:hypothetical protein
MLATGLATATAQTSIKVPDAMPEDTCVTCSDGPTGGCTSIMVGREATTDGSVITAHTCDGNYRTWLDIVPSEEHSAGATRPVYWGKLHNETPWDMRGLRLKGEIPQADSTFAFFNVAYPAMNEKGLSIGETTIGGRDELRNPEGLFLIENLQAIALERTTNARDAISLIGELVATSRFKGPARLRLAQSGRRFGFRTTTLGYPQISLGFPRWTWTTPTITWRLKTCTLSPKRWAGGIQIAARSSSSGKPTVVGHLSRYGSSLF